MCAFSDYLFIKKLAALLIFPGARPPIKFCLLFFVFYLFYNTLGNMQVDELKLDLGFLIAAAKETCIRQRLIMAQIILFSQKKDITTVTEGIETAGDEEMIRELGCD